MSPLTGYDLPVNSTVDGPAMTDAAPLDMPPDAGVNRRYMMLEERNLADVVSDFLVNHYDLDSPAREVIENLRDAGVVLMPLGVREARNADHAYRQIARERLGDEAGSMELVAVAEKMWKPTPVTSSPAKHTLKVGR